MMRAWLGAHRSLVATATSGSVIAALIATVAIVSSGYSAQRLDLNDGAVWVTNSAEQALGRANTAVLELNAVVPAQSPDLDVVQDGRTALLFDRGNSKVDVVNAGTSEIDKSVPVPPTGTEVLIAGERVIVTSRDTGEVWLVPRDDFENFDAKSEPTLSFGSRTVVSVDETGVLYAFSGDAGELYRVDTAASDSVGEVREVSFDEPDAEYQVTSIAGRPAVFEANSRQLDFDGRQIDLSGIIPVGSEALLQRASATGDELLVAHEGGLVSVPLDGAPRVVSSSPSGTPAAPVSVAGCDYAAWSNGTAWQRCDGTSDGSAAQLAGLQADASLAYRVNNDRVVLNDGLSGAAWAVQRDNGLIDNWDELIERDQDAQVVEENDVDTPPEFEKAQLPPAAVDDEFGARPGRANVLPVLLNDFDPNGDVLVIRELTEIDESVGRLDLIHDRQQVQITLAPSATGAVSFGYTIDDGRGGSASATVTVTVRGDDENSPPQQVRTSTGTVQSGGRLTTQVLGDWYDPDADAFYLARAVVAGPDTVSWKPEGTVVFGDSGSGGDLKPVSLVVSDGRAEGAGSLSVKVRSAGDVPIVAEPFVVLAHAGEEVTVSPLAHVRGGTGVIRLTNVPATAGTRITADYDGGTFRFSSSDIRTHYLEYTVTDGSQTETGSVRVDVTAPPEANTRPITVTHTAFIRQLTTQTVDVLASDIDPAGGVLLVTGVSDVQQESGVRVEILEQRLLRVTLTQPLDGPVAFNYRVSNGLADAEGTVTIVEIPAPAVKQPPVAVPDTVSVRVGDAIDIPVLDNDSHPDGDPLTLAPELTEKLPAGSGLLFVSQNRLRYLAPNKTGNFTALYRVEAPDGQWSTAKVTIAVREVDEASNNPPVPKTVTARVLAGESVRIPIPLVGIDPDGDSVQLLGQETSPEKGAVTDVGPDWIEYEAGSYSAGTDTFTYAVVGALGARAIGTVRVGIGQRADGARNPVAVADEVTVRPGGTVTVQVLGNDSDPDGGVLTVTGVQAALPGLVAEVEDDLVRVEVPAETGRYGFVYDIANQRGGTSSNFLTVVVAEDAPLSQPVAKDTVLTLSDIVDRETVDVNVLANVFFADGAVRDLGLEVQPGYRGSAEVTAGKRIRVTIRDERQIIPFRVTHPEDPSVSSYAFVWVPGFADALPQLRQDAPRLTVESESTLTIDLNDHVVAVGGRTVRLADANAVRATHADGTDLVAGPSTLRFTSADKYFGPASISFDVTDGATAQDPDGRTATLVLPITVTPRENQPPAFNGAVLEFEPAQERVIDLLELTTYPYRDDQDELRYSVVGQAPQGFDHSIDGSQLTLRAGERVSGTTDASITIGVRDTLNEGKAGRIQLRVVPSTRPIAQPALDSVVAPRGETTVVDVLQNDEATNPFPGRPLEVVAVRGIDSASLPAGVTVVPSPDRSRLFVTVADDVEPTDISVQYQIMDATKNPQRNAWGTARISIQDRPDPVTNLRAIGFGDRRVTVTFDVGAANNSPIQGYEVRAVREGAVLSSRTCVATTCDVATDGNGPDRRVTIVVSAINAIGASDATRLASVWSDIVPPAPTGLRSNPLDHGLRIFWDRPNETGAASPIQYWEVTVGGESRQARPRDCAGATCSIDVVAGGIPNTPGVRYSVSARNGALGSLASWNSSVSTGSPAGAPTATGAVPSAEASVDGSNTVTLSWNGIFGGNGRDIRSYYAAGYPRGSTVPSCTASGVGSDDPRVSAEGGLRRVDATSTTFDVPSDSAYRFIVYAYNGQGCTAAPEAEATTRTPPAATTAVVLRAPEGGEGTRFEPVFAGVTPDPSPADGTKYYEYRLLVDGAPVGGVMEINPGQTIEVGAHYNRNVSIQVRVAIAYPGLQERLRSADWGAESERVVAVDTTVNGLSFTDEAEDPDLLDRRTRTYFWTTVPPQAEVRCFVDGREIWQEMTPDTDGCATRPFDSREQAPELEWRVTQNEQTYTNRFQGS